MLRVGFCVAVSCALVLLAGCSRNYRLYKSDLSKEAPLKTVAIVPVDIQWHDLNIGGVELVAQDKWHRFSELLMTSAEQTLNQFGLESSVVFGDQSLLELDRQKRLVFEAGLERKKVLTDLAQSGSFTRYARYISRPRLDSRVSYDMQKVARELGVSGFVLVHMRAETLSGSEYVREWFRSAMITIASFFISTTLAHQSYLSGDLMLIDGRNGRVLFFNKVRNFVGSPDNRDDLDDLFEELLSPLQYALY
jgi:hypothetical protein